MAGAEGISGEGDDRPFLCVLEGLREQRLQEVVLSQRESVPRPRTHGAGQVGMKERIESRVLHFGSESWDLFMVNSKVDSSSPINYEFKVNISSLSRYVSLHSTR